MIWSIALGSAVGGVTRYLLGLFIHQRTGVPFTSFPIGTMIINVTGSLLLGFLIRWILATPDVSQEVRYMLTTGFCGGYTTFSSFSYETAALMEDGRYGRALTYVILSVILSLLGTFAGFQLARTMLVLRGRA